jgi:hypothetical protein
MILHWDNTPHHKHIKTFPHHKHTGDTISESTEIGLKEVLDSIQNDI